MVLQFYLPDSLKSFPLVASTSATEFVFHPYQQTNNSFTKISVVCVLTTLMKLLVSDFEFDSLENSSQHIVKRQGFVDFCTNSVI